MDMLEKSTLIFVAFVWCWRQDAFRVWTLRGTVSLWGGECFLGREICLGICLNEGWFPVTALKRPRRPRVENAVMAGNVVLVQTRAFDPSSPDPSSTPICSHKKAKEKESYGTAHIYQL